MENLSSIIESRSKTLLLSFLILSPERTFTVRELSARLGISRGKLTHDLKSLAGQNIVKVFSKGRQVYYLLNQKHKLMAELRPSLLKNQRGYGDELFSAIRRLGVVRAAFLSGVFTGYSDLPVDILLVGKINLNRLHDFLDTCRKLMGVEINYSIMTEAEFIQRRDTFDRFIKDIFDYRHVIVVDKVAKKKKPRRLAPQSKFNISHF
jgi:hypothetical protein